MKEIILHGSLGARFGERFFLDVRDPAEAVRALSVQLTGFREALAKGHWHLVLGSLVGGSSIDVAALTCSLGATKELHFMPAIAGAGGFLGSVGGALLVGVSFLVGGPGLALAVGAGLAVTSLIAMGVPASAADAASRERPDQKPSFLFDGPVNTSTQGLPVPIICGRVRVGSVVISAGMTAEQI